MDQLSKIAEMERKGETVTLRTYLDHTEEEIAELEDETEEIYKEIFELQKNIVILKERNIYLKNLQKKRNAASSSEPQ